MQIIEQQPRIALRVRAALRQSRRTNAQIAEASGLSLRSLQRRLAGERDFFVVELVRIGIAIDRDPGDFLEKMLRP